MDTPASTPRPQLANIDWTALARFAVLGGAVGSGAALVRALSRHISSISEDNNDKQYLALKVPAPSFPDEAGQRKVASGKGLLDETGAGYGPMKLWTYLLGVPAAYFTGLGAYKGVSKLYDRYQEKQLTGELDEAQRDYLASLQDERKQLTKAAAGELFGPNNTPTSLTDMAMLALLGSIPLASYASHVLTKRYLEKAFPERRPINADVPPVRVEVDPTMTRKQAAALDDTHAWHLAGRIVMEHTKGASVLDDLVNVAADGRITELEDVMCEDSFEKAAAFAEAIPARDRFVAARSLGLLTLLKSASMREPVKAVISGEIHAMGPTAKMAHFRDTNAEHTLLIVGSLAGSMGILADLLTVKEARDAMMQNPDAIKLDDPGQPDKKDMSETLAGALEAFATQDPKEHQLAGQDDDALVSLLTSGQHSTDSRGDKKDVEGASMPGKDDIDEFFEALPNTGRDKRPQPFRPKTEAAPEQVVGGRADYRG